jgi:chromosome partitioning protein
MRTNWQGTALMLINTPGHPSLRKIVVLNPKGGSGKTTLATNLAGYLAVTGRRVALMDLDPQGSSMRWLNQRPATAPPIHGIAGYDYRSSATRSWQLRVPSEMRYLVVDSPAAIPAHRLADFTTGAHAIVVPVLPSDIDIHAASRLVADLLTVARVSRRMGRLGIVANRMRENTLACRKLMTFLDRLSIPVVTTLRDSQNYLRAAADGLSVQEIHGRRALVDLPGWPALTEWIDTRLETALTPRDLFRPTASIPAATFFPPAPQAAATQAVMA